jgi:hypothetical protein
MDHAQIREFLMISLGDKPSKSFTPTCARIVMERVWKVLNVHNDFRELRTRDQVPIQPKVTNIRNLHIFYFCYF